MAAASTCTPEELELALSPALSGDDDAYAEQLEEYDKLTVKSGKRFEAYAESDKSFKDQQDELYELLSQGDAQWQQISESTGSTRKSAVEGLRGNIDKMYANLDAQEATLDALIANARRAARALEDVAAMVPDLKAQTEAVRESLEERLDGMRAAEPGLSKKKKPERTAERVERAERPAERPERAERPAERAAERAHSPSRRRPVEKVPAPKVERRSSRK